MKALAYRHALTAALIVVLAGCTDDNENVLSPGVGNSPVEDTGAGQMNALADLDRLIAEADAYRFVAGILREDASLSNVGGPSNEPLFTDVSASAISSTHGTANQAERDR